MGLIQKPAKKTSMAANYWLATRTYSFPASIVSVLLGTALAARGYAGGTPHFDALILLLTLLGALLAHAGGNVFNDYYDFIKGVDTQPEHGSGVLPRGMLTTRQMRRFGVLLLAGAGLCGLLLVLHVPLLLGLVAPLALLGLACAVLYTSILKQRALGDIVIMTAFGLGLTLGAYGVQTPIQSGAAFGMVLLYALPLTLLVDAILHANNIRDAQGDRASGYQTVATLLGPHGSQALQGVLVFGPVVLVVGFTLLHLLPATSLAVLLALPVLIKAYRSGDVPFTAQAHLLFGLLYAISVMLTAHP